MAVGYRNSPRVDVLSAEDLRDLYSVRTPPHKVNSSRLAWSVHGHVLYHSVHFVGLQAGLQALIRGSAEAGRGAFVDIPVGPGEVTDFIALKAGGIVYAGRDPVFGVLDSQGRTTLEHRSGAADFRRISSSGNLRVLRGRFDGDV